MVAPPPPPLPPQPPSLPSLRLSTTRALKPKTTQHVTSQHRDQPSGNLVAAAKARITGLAPSTKPTTPDLQPFAPCHMFFYGSLMDPEVIETIAKLQSPAQVRTATITGFRVKMWGIYPTLIPDEHGKVDGVVWEVTSEDRFDRLAAYETDAYCCTVCDAVLEDGTVLEGCRTFCWAGDLDSGDLEDGKFDLERYRRYFKSSVVRPRQAGKN